MLPRSMKHESMPHNRHSDVHVNGERNARLKTLPTTAKQRKDG